MLSGSAGFRFNSTGGLLIKAFVSSDFLKKSSLKATDLFKASTAFIASPVIDLSANPY